MRYSVGLESPFAFSNYWYAVGAGLIILGVALWYAGGRYLKRFSHKYPAFFKKRILSRCRKKYLQKIEEVESAFGKGELETRGVCQNMSRDVRDFVQEVTGWRTDTMVYLELLRLDRPELAELVRQYYEPEFAFYSEADAKLAIENGKELIRKWE